MTVKQKRKLLIRIQRTEKDIEELKEIRAKLASSEFKSATLASSGGSKSYTRQDIGEITDAISKLTSELKADRRLLREQAVGFPTQIYQVYF